MHNVNKRNSLALLFLCLITVILSTSCSSKKSITINSVVNCSLNDIQFVMVSPEIYYLDDCGCDVSTGQWATIRKNEDIEKLYTSIGNVKVEDAGDFDVSLAGGAPRYVVYFLNNGTEIQIKLVDDMQIWIDGKAYNFRAGESVYREIDDVLENYAYESKSE